jgi:hypothetical protein
MSIRYSENPFINGMIVPIKDKKIKLSRIGREDNVLINQTTGEISGTHVTTYRKVDSENFIKLFTQNIALTFDLNSAGIKAFNLMVWSLQNLAIDKDQIPLDKYVLENFVKANQSRTPPIKLSTPTLNRGLRELEKAQIIAKTIRPGWFFINPNFCFNGDRIAFTTLIERQKIHKNINDKTLDWVDEITDKQN